MDEAPNPYESPREPSEPSLIRRPSRISHGLIAVVINAMVWHLGVFLDVLGGWADQLGALFCQASGFAALIMIPITLMLSYDRWKATGRPDLYGPASAIILWLWIQIMMVGAIRI